MSSRLMLLPAELRVRIYEYAFCDNEPDEVDVFDTGDEVVGETAVPQENAAPTESAATDDERVGLNAKLPGRQKSNTRQIELLKAKDHYPDPALLAICKLIHQEAAPIFEAATKVFWDIDVFNIKLLHPPSCPEWTLETLFSTIFLKFMKGRPCPQVGITSLFQKHPFKALRFSWPAYYLTVRRIRTMPVGSFPVLSSDIVGSDANSRRRMESSWLVEFLELPVEGWRPGHFDGDLLDVPKVFTVFLDIQFVILSQLARPRGRYQ